MNRAALGLSALAAALLPACVFVVQPEPEASGPFIHPAPERVERELGPFRRVLVEGSVDVELRTGVPRRVRVEGDKGRLAEVRTELREGTLVVSFPAESRLFRDGPRVVVEVEALDALVAAGSGWIAVSGLDQERLEVELRGPGDVRLRGKVGALAARVTGAGQLDVLALAAGSIQADVQGPGSVRGAPRGPG
jgi:hypothetical protein